MYLLAAKYAGLSPADLDYLTIGMVLDLLAEKNGGYEREARQSDYDNF